MRWLRMLAPVLLAVFVLTAYRVHPAPGVTGRHLVVSIAVYTFPLGVLGTDALARRPFAPVYIGFVAVTLGAAGLLLSVQPTGPAAAGLLVGAVCAARLLPRTAVIPVLVVVFIVLEVIAGISGQGFGALAVLAAFAAFYAMLILAFRLSEANRAAERLLTEVEQSRSAQVEAAAMAERQRLAREMHDVLAHSLAGLMLQLEGARMLAAQDPSDPRLPQALERAHQLGRAGLVEARRAIGALRDDELPGPERLPSLAAQFEQDSAVPCRLTVSGAVFELGSQARLAVYRVAQEALTNIAKHASAELVELHLAYEPRLIRLCIEDFGAAPSGPTDGGSNRQATHTRTGRGPGDASPAEAIGGGSSGQQLEGDAGGYGLTGMRERAELLGATLTTTPTPGGFRVQLDVPA